jgi:hypothetical protein
MPLSCLRPHAAAVAKAGRGSAGGLDVHSEDQNDAQLKPALTGNGLYPIRLVKLVASS